MEVKIEGKLICKEDMSHEEFIHMFVEVLHGIGVYFKGETKIIDDVKTYKKISNII